MKRLALLWFVILAAAACVEKSDEQPQPTLQLYTPNISSKFGSVIYPSMTATPGGIEVANMPVLTLIGPVCSETLTQTLICTGWVYNPLETTFASVSVNVALIDEANQTLSTQTGTIARDWLLPGSGAPYRVIFPEAPQENVTPIVTLVMAEPSGANRIAAMEVQNLQMLAENDQYRISGEVFNDTSDRVSPVRVVVTLLDSSGEVAGYREIELEQLVSGSRVPFEILIMPQGTSADQVYVTADGYRR